MHNPDPVSHRQSCQPGCRPPPDPDDDDAELVIMAAILRQLLMLTAEDRCRVLSYFVRRFYDESEV
jgi:hypothetical protein